MFKMIKITLTLSFLLMTCIVWSQSYVDALGADRFASTRALDDFNVLKNILSEEEILLANVKGSMYYNSVFEQSTVIFNGNPVEEKAFLRYNSYKDEIEIGKNSNQKKALNVLVKNLNVEAQIGSKYYKPFALNSKKNTELTYLVKIFSSQEHNLYLHEMKKFIDEKPAPSGIGGFLSARFEDRFILYYSSNLEEVPTILKINKKSILKIFPEKQNTIKKFISREKIKLKDYKDVHYIFKNLSIL